MAQDGVVGDQTWAVSLHAASATLETAVSLHFVIGKRRTRLKQMRGRRL
jgi:hypothetical protein